MDISLLDCYDKSLLHPTIKSVDYYVQPAARSGLEYAAARGQQTGLQPTPLFRLFEQILLKTPMLQN